MATTGLVALDVIGGRLAAGGGGGAATGASSGHASAGALPTTGTLPNPGAGERANGTFRSILRAAGGGTTAAGGGAGALCVLGVAAFLIAAMSGLPIGV